MVDFSIDIKSTLAGRCSTCLTRLHINKGYYLNYFSRFKLLSNKIFIVGVVCVLTGIASGAFVIAQQQRVVVPIQDAKLVPTNPAQPNGNQVGLLWGDPKTGPSSMFIKLKKGTIPMHLHSSDYHSVVLEGTIKFWGEGETESEAKTLGPKGYWYQPGNLAHAEACVTDECLIYIKWEGKIDNKRVEASGK